MRERRLDVSAARGAVLCMAFVDQRKASQMSAMALLVPPTWQFVLHIISARWYPPGFDQSALSVET